MGRFNRLSRKKSNRDGTTETHQNDASLQLIAKDFGSELKSLWEWLHEMESVDIEKWVAKNGHFYGPGKLDDTNWNEEFPRLEDLIAFFENGGGPLFLKKRGYDDSEWRQKLTWRCMPDALIAEFRYEQSNDLSARFVFLKREDESYVGYLAWAD